MFSDLWTRGKVWKSLWMFTSHLSLCPFIGREAGDFRARFSRRGWTESVIRIARRMSCWRIAVKMVHDHSGDSKPAALGEGCRHRPRPETHDCARATFLIVAF